ncbi:MAG: hypothetical protein ACFE94_05310 [Candidatus Hodarchaeota archaeon]
MEVLKLKPISNKKIVIYLLENIGFDSQLTDLEILKEIIENNNIKFITVDINGINFKTFKNSTLLRILNAFNIEYYLLDMPEHAYGCLYAEITKNEEKISELLQEYRNMDDKYSFKGLNLKSWIDVLKKEVFQDKNILELKTRPQWIVKKILDIVRTYQNEKIFLIHFAHKITLPEIIKQLKELQIEAIVYDYYSIHNIPYLIIKQGESN